MLCLAVVGCAAVPEVRELRFEVDDAELHGEDERHIYRSIDAAIRALREDPALHLRVVGHADEDNEDVYNFDLSRRRADHVRALILRRAPELAPRIDIAGRGELDPAEASESDAAKRANRRVELVFHYPRQCELSWGAEFLACEAARLYPPAEPPATSPEIAPKTLPEPSDIDTPAPSAAEASAQDRPRTHLGPFVYASGGYGVGIKEFVRHHAVVGGGGGYLWGRGSTFRMSGGLGVDGFIDRGFVFGRYSPCAVDCRTIARDYLRILPEYRLGGIRERMWVYARFGAGVLWLLPESGDAVMGANFGIGLGVAFTLWRGLYLGLDSMISVSRFGGLDGGQGLHDVKTTAGWRFGR